MGRCARDPCPLLTQQRAASLNFLFFQLVPYLSRWPQLKHGADPSIRSEHGFTCLHMAASKGLFKVV